MNAPHRDTGFFTEPLATRDAELFGAITQELGRQRHEIELIKARLKGAEAQYREHHAKRTKT